MVRQEWEVQDFPLQYQTGKHLVRVVTESHDSANNIEYKCQGWFTLWNDADTPWIVAGFGGSSKENIQTVDPSCQLQGQAYDDDGLKSINVEVFKDVDGNWIKLEDNCFTIDLSKKDYPTYYAWSVASLTDMLDGKIARKFNLVTDLGKFLDPIADKLLNDAMMIFILVPQAYALDQRSNPTMLTILLICVVIMIARDLIVDALRLIAVKKDIVIAANIFGKMKTVLQMIAIPMMLLNDWPFSYFDSNWHPALQISNWFFYAATIMSIVSGVIYVYQNREVFKGFSK